MAGTATPTEAEDPAPLSLLRTATYIIVSGMTITIWELFLTFPSEVAFIWSSLYGTHRFSIVRCAYIFSRYGLCAVMVLLSIVGTSFFRSFPLSNSLVCGDVNSFIILAIVVIDAVWHSLTLLRVFIICDRSKAIFRGVVFGIAVVYAVSIPFAVLIVKKLHSASDFDPGPEHKLNICIPNQPVRLFVGIWLPEAALDIYAIVLIFWNAITRPRLETQRLTKILSGDGMLMILGTWFLRVTNVVFCITNNVILGMIGIILFEPIVSALNARLFFKFYMDDRRSSITSESQRDRSTYPSEFLDLEWDEETIFTNRQSDHKKNKSTEIFMLSSRTETPSSPRR